MTANDILKLVNAGFSKAEINAMLGAAAAESKPEEPKPAADPKPEPEKAPEPAPDPKPAEQNSAIEQLTAQVSQLTALVQKSNLLRMEQPDAKPDTPEDIIASIIFPTYGKDSK